MYHLNKLWYFFVVSFSTFLFNLKKSIILSLLIFVAHFYFSLKFEISEDNNEIKKDNTTISINNKNKLKNKNILVVDDSMSNRLLCRAILEDYKCNFYVAIQGKEVIEIIKKSIKIDCIIMKLSMQIMNGFTTSKTIRA